MGRGDDGREPSPEEKENEAISKFLAEVWSPEKERLPKLFEKPEADLKKAQARGKGKRGKDGADGAIGKKGARGDRGARGERPGSQFKPNGAGASACNRSFSAKIINVNATVLQVAVTGVSLTITGYKQALMAQLVNGTLVDDIISGIWGGTNALCERARGLLTQAFGVWSYKRALAKRKARLKARTVVVLDEES